MWNEFQSLYAYMYSLVMFIAMNISIFFPEHQNYVGIDTDKNPYFLSVVSQDSGNKCVPLYRAILFRKQVSNIFKSPEYFF